MSDETLAATVSNFDAIVARNSAKLESSDAAKDDAPDTHEVPGSDDATEVEEADLEEVSDDDAAELEEAEAEEAEAEDAVEPEVRAPLKALRAALKGGEVTPELLAAIGDLKLEVKLPGGPSKVPVKELAQGYMRTQRFHQELERTKETAAQAQRIIAIERQRTQSWQTDPAQLAQGLRAMGCEETMKAAFWEWAQQEYNYRSMTPEQRARHDYQQKVEAERQTERAKLFEMQRQLEQARASGQQLDPVTQQTAAYIESNMDKTILTAFKAQGVDTRVTNDDRRVFLQSVRNFCESGMELPDAMAEASNLLAERLADLAGLRAQAKKAATTKPKELPARKAPAGSTPEARAKAPASKTKRPATAAEFARRFGGG